MWPGEGMNPNSLATVGGGRGPVGGYTDAGWTHSWWHQQLCLFFSFWQLLSTLDSCPKEHRCFLQASFPGQR